MGYSFFSAPVTLLGNMYSAWQTSGGIFTSKNDPLHVSLDFSLSGVAVPSELQSPFRVQVRYYDGNQFIVEEHTFGTDGGSIEFDIGADSLSSVKFRVAGFGGVGVQEVAVNSSFMEFSQDPYYEHPNFLVVPDGMSEEEALAHHNFYKLTEIGSMESSFQNINLAALAATSYSESISLSSGATYWNTGGIIWGLPSLSGAIQDLLDPLSNSLVPADDWLGELIDSWGLAKNNGSPLVLDLDGDGVELVSLENTSVYWDIDADGFAEASGWVGADDGLLAIDLNNDGNISYHEELFGNLTMDGFADLRALDTNADNVINANDAQFDDLLVWRDVNQNGRSDEGELYSLTDLNITSINLNASTPYNMYIEGNHISHVSTYTMDDGISPPQTLAIVDAWFNYDNVNTRYDQDYTLDLASLFVVTQRGYGELPDMHIAASIDNDITNPDSLMSLLAAFTARDFASAFTNGYSVLDEVTTIMYRWAGVDDVDPASRGSFIDARKLEFLEALTGEPYRQQGMLADPLWFAAEFLDKAFEIARYAVTGRLLAQVAGNELFEGNAFYNPASDKFEGVTGLNLDALDALLAQSNDGLQVSDKTGFWVMVINAINEVVGIDNLSIDDVEALNDMLFASDAGLSVDAVLDRVVWNKDSHLSNLQQGQSWGGTGGDDAYTSGAGNDSLDGGYGNDVINGGLGNDTISGGFGNDTLIGGLGDDVLHGNGGADTYVYLYGHGHDYISEAGHDIDTIEFGEGIALSDLTIRRFNNNELNIQIAQSAGGGSITIWHNVEILKFFDNSTFDLRTMGHTYIGTSGNDSVWGHVSGTIGSGADTMYGFDGNDVLTAYGPNEHDYNTNYLYGGNGNDTLYGGRGVDYLYGENDNDIVNGDNGNDLLVGGLGDDILRGGSDNDSYIFNYGDGNDTIEETHGTADKIIFGEGVTQEMLHFYRLNNNDVKLEIDGGLGGSILLKSQAYSSGSVVEYVELFDSTLINISLIEMTLVGTAAGETLTGTSFGASGVNRIYGMGGNDTIWGVHVSHETHSNYLYGGNGNDTLYGSRGVDYLYGDDDNDILNGDNGNDLLVGGLGDDILRGGSDNDSYIFNYGDGNDTIEESHGTADKILFGEGVTQEMLHFYRLNNNDVKLEIDGGLGGSILLKNQTYTSGSIVEYVELFDSSLIDIRLLEMTLVGTSAGETLTGITQGASINDTIYGMGGNDTIITGAGNDSLSGGMGNDILRGDAGSDTYLFAYGDGHDTIEEYYEANDKIVFAADITQSMINIYRTSQSDLKIDIDGGTGGSITIKNQNSHTYYAVEMLEFADDSTIDLYAIDLTLIGTSGNDYLYGAHTASSGVDIIYGMDGNDTISGYYSYNDTKTNYLHGGNGNDTLNGAAGTDYLYGDDGTDTLNGANGDDYLHGGAGSDTLTGGSGADTFVFSLSDISTGVDTIADFSVAQNDKIDLSDLLDQYDPLNDALSDFVSITQSGSHSILSVDVDGGANNFVHLATLNSTSGLTDVQALYNSGNIVV